MNQEPKGNILPIYFVADQSASMHSSIKELNMGLISLKDEICMQPFAAANVRFSVIGFNDQATLYLSNEDLRNDVDMPVLVAAKTTYFSTAFDLLNSQISEDVALLKFQGYKVNRPAVFLLTDGKPMRDDSWQAPLSNLMNDKSHPNLLVFGVGNADPETVLSMASRPDFAFQAAKGADTGQLLSEFMTYLTQSVIASGVAAGSGSQPLIEIPKGFLAIDNDEI